MNYEDQLSRLNEHYFYREFTFSKNTFRPKPGLEVELADNILWLDRQLVVFQLKERAGVWNSSADDEVRWFDRKVVTAGTRQIRDTLNYLDDHAHVELENHCGHQFRLNRSGVDTVHKVICYLPHEELPAECRAKKYHRSRTAGVIHLFSANDYLGVVQTLLTPTELFEYLAFRGKLIEKWPDAVESVAEEGLVGQYLKGDANSSPDIHFVEYVEALQHRADEWDMSGVIKKFPDRGATANQPTDYYRIVTELAKLKRGELREFKMRFELSMENCRAGVFVRPYRMACPRTRCGFVFIPLEKETLTFGQQWLQNLTFGCKYDLGLPKCIGVSFAPEEDGWFSVMWCYLNSRWEYDAELSEGLKKFNFFRDVSTKEVDRYNFRRDG